MLSDSLPYVKRVYTGVGTYTFSFKVFDVDDLSLQHFNAVGEVANLTTGQYTAVINPDYNGGTVTITDVALSTPGTLNIRRLLPYQQDTDWGNNDPFSMELLERTQDKLVMMIQQIGHIIANTNASWRGDWVTGVVYSERELSVGPDGDWYACLISHVAGTFVTDVSAGNWEKTLPLSDFTAKYNQVVLDAAQVAVDLLATVAAKDTAVSSATNALVSQNAAATSASNASTSANNAATSESNAAATAAAMALIADVKADKTLLNTGAIIVPQGTTAQRPTPGADKHIRYNSDLLGFEGFNGSVWGSLGGGATGGSSDKVFIENDQIVTTNYSITAGKSAMATGPLTINDGVVITIPTGSRLVIL